MGNPGVFQVPGFSFSHRTWDIDFSSKCSDMYFIYIYLFQLIPHKENCGEISFWRENVSFQVHCHYSVCTCIE